MSPEIRRLRDRINEYLIAGGLWNPEAMEHDKVRLLLFDLRDELEALLASQRPPTEERCICEIDKHDFNCPVHNDHAPESRMHHE